MASNLYDSGKPQRVIVEHTINTQALVDGFCPRSPGWSCEYTRSKYGPCVVCPYRPAAKVTIAPQFQVIDEPKRLK
jgi:hypothetical protein